MCLAISTVLHVLPSYYLGNGFGGNATGVTEGGTYSTFYFVTVYDLQYINIVYFIFSVYSHTCIMDCVVQIFV